MHWIPPFWGSMTSDFCPKTKQSINRSFSKSKFVEIFLSLKSVFLLCASVCVCMDLSQWKSWFSNFRNYVPRIDWGLLPEWRIYRVALRNGDHIGPENWGPKRCNHPSEIGYLGQEADLVTDWCMSVISFFYKRYSLDPIKVGQRKIVGIELLKHFPKGRLRVIDEFLGCTPPSWSWQNQWKVNQIKIGIIEGNKHFPKGRLR